MRHCPATPVYPTEMAIANDDKVHREVNKCALNIACKRKWI